ncbi:hypothetical protein EDB86DRAFT_2833443 [Lactarius hatsudake]|nr:hypothetical protein EDB86DRAFT_2833443 [Lactarius hatsudake]
MVDITLPHVGLCWAEKTLACWAWCSVVLPEHMLLDGQKMTLGHHVETRNNAVSSGIQSDGERQSVANYMVIKCTCRGFWRKRCAPWRHPGWLVPCRSMGWAIPALLSREVAMAEARGKAGWEGRERQDSAQGRASSEGAGTTRAWGIASMGGGGRAVHGAKPAARPGEHISTQGMASGEAEVAHWHTGHSWWQGRGSTSAHGA